MDHPQLRFRGGRGSTKNSTRLRSLSQPRWKDNSGAGRSLEKQFEGKGRKFDGPIWWRGSRRREEDVGSAQVGEERGKWKEFKPE